MTIKRVELEGRYNIVVENDDDKKETCLGVENYILMFTKKSDVNDFMALLETALEFWEYESEVE